ncbi:uracil-DNA glycosylase-like protein [Apiospora saccharicola]|uniref:Uracil-DNA glycosylase n=1 Tax=Apiospora saccharicola TaxID=335842 RepID=A0ABR1VMP3_9PEZI
MSTLKRKAAAATEANKKSKPNASITSFFGAPKPAAAIGASSSSAAAAAPEPAAVKFDKAKWVASLKPEQKKLLQLEIDTLDVSWLAHLKDEITSKEFLDLKQFLEREKTQGKKVFPPQEDIYSWSRHTPFHSVKVVILGQDPYHNDNQAHGLAFSVRPPTTTPPSLRNIFIGLKKDYPDFVVPAKNAGYLVPWADRGVLMLNTCLTVRAHEANSHANRGWERFTQKVIDLVAARRTRGVAFMAWGTPAGKRVLKVDQKRHLVLKSVHPSPLSAMRGFFDCGHFRKANDWLVTRYGAGAEIDWDLTPKKAAPPAAPAAPAADVKVEAKVDGKAKGDVEVKDEKEKENVVPPPAVIVSGTDDEDGSVQEKTKVLDKAGKNLAVKEEE